VTCSDVERVLPEFLDGASDSLFPTDFQAHVESCAGCSDLVADLKLIASEARQLAATEEPAPRVWVRIAAELRAEGLIREPESVPARPVLVPTSPRRQWRAWWLAPIAASLVAAGAYVVSHKPAPQVAKQAPIAPIASPVGVTASVPATPAVVPTPTPAPKTAPAPQQLAEKSTPREAMPHRSAGPAPSAEDQQFLSVVSTLSPSMRTTYELQLQAVNADIRETQAYVNQNPRDVDARQHLMDAYQQKALLYQIALDRIQ
jgi:hypothetical protein